MSRRMISDELYERYVDVSVEVFMECYVSFLMNNIEKQTDSLCEEELEFPPQLDARCRALIAKECARNKRKQYAKGIAKCLRAVAVFAVAILSLSSILFMTVDAVRIPIINYYIEHGDGHWIITSDANASPESLIDEIDVSDPLASLIPDEYYLNAVVGSTIHNLIAKYSTTSGNNLYFTSNLSTNMLHVDDEDAQISQKCEIVGCDAVLVIEDHNVRLTWIHKETSTTFTLISNDMTETEVVGIAEHLIYKISN